VRSYASMMLMAGEHVMWVEKRLGHNSPVSDSKESGEGGFEPREIFIESIAYVENVTGI
jgi:hypothetical protein